MLFYETDEDFKGALEHDIEWNEERIKSIEGWIKTLNEWRKRASGADIESIRSGITNSEDAIKAHRGFIAHAQERYVERYGNRYGAQKLTVIKGGKA